MTQPRDEGVIDSDPDDRLHGPTTRDVMMEEARPDPQLNQFED